MGNLVQPLNPGTIVADYTVDRVLGQGGFGTTYLCGDNNLQRQCVLKEFTPHEIVERGRNGELKPKSWRHRKQLKLALKTFLSEAQKLARFSHPNIARINRYFPGNGTAYFVMDYEKGVALRTLIANASERFDERQIQALLVPL